MAGTTEDKLRAVLDSKERIRMSIEEKGVECGADVPFSAYPQKILSIEGGGSGGIKFGTVGAGGQISGTVVNIVGAGQYVQQDIE